jgi:hypothetical protein
VDDQQIVMDLLNAIPAVHGGAAGSLGGRVVLGIASEALCQAISRFEDRHFPRQRSGFVDPDGAMLKRMLKVLSELPAHGGGLQVVKLIDRSSPKLLMEDFELAPRRRLDQ